MNNKRWGFAATAAVAAGILLVGCAGSSTPIPIEPASSHGPVTLTYWDFIDPSQDNPRANALKDEHGGLRGGQPEHQTSNSSVVSLGDMINRLPQAAAAGQAPDVFKMFTPTVPQMAAAGAYSPLPSAASAEITMTGSVRSTDLVGPDGAQVAVPYEYRTCAFFYNEKILAEIGA